MCRSSSHCCWQERPAPRTRRWWQSASATRAAGITARELPVRAVAEAGRLGAVGGGDRPALRRHHRPDAGLGQHRHRHRAERLLFRQAGGGEEDAPGRAGRRDAGGALRGALVVGAGRAHPDGADPAEDRQGRGRGGPPPHSARRAGLQAGHRALPALVPEVVRRGEEGGEEEGHRALRGDDRLPPGRRSTWAVVRWGRVQWCSGYRRATTAWRPTGDIGAWCGT